MSTRWYLPAVVTCEYDIYRHLHYLPVEGVRPMNRARRIAQQIIADETLTEDEITEMIVTGLGWPDTDATPRKGPTMKSFHILLTDNSERDVKGADLRVDSVGSLLVVAEGANSDKGPYSVIYAPGTWSMAELERKDDKG